MNYTFIVLGTILVFILFILYKVFTEKKTSLASSKQFSAVSHSYKDLSKPSSNNYSISVWMYASGLPSGEQCIFDIYHEGSEILGIYVNNNSQLHLKHNSINHQISDIIPIQQWTHIIISVSNNSIVDSYIDGKLLKSQSLSINPLDVSSIIREGGNTSIDSNFSGTEIAGFERIPEITTPSQAWSKYMSGNGGNSITRYLSSYGISLVLTKDDVDEKTLKFPP